LRVSQNFLFCQSECGDSLVPPHLGPERRRAPVHHPGRAQSMPASRGVVPKENMGSVRLLDAGCIAIAEGMT